MRNTRLFLCCNHCSSSATRPALIIVLEKESFVIYNYIDDTNLRHIKELFRHGKQQLS